MKSYKKFISESINITGDFNGNLYVNSEGSDKKSVGEEYTADVFWNGNLYRMNLTSNTGIPTKRDLGEQLQSNYPGAIVQQIYPLEEKNEKIKSIKRYHPSKLEWID